MIKLIHFIKTLIISLICLVQTFYKKVCNKMFGRFRTVLSASSAEGYVDTGVKVLIAVVLGALLLTLLYSLFNDVIGPTVGDRVYKLFEYAG